MVRRGGSLAPAPADEEAGYDDHDNERDGKPCDYNRVATAVTAVTFVGLIGSGSAWQRRSSRWRCGPNAQTPGQPADAHLERALVEPD